MNSKILNLLKKSNFKYKIDNKVDKKEEKNIEKNSKNLTQSKLNKYQLRVLNEFIKNKKNIPLKNICKKLEQERSSLRLYRSIYKLIEKNKLIGFLNIKNFIKQNNNNNDLINQINNFPILKNQNIKIIKYNTLSYKEFYIPNKINKKIKIYRSNKKLNFTKNNNIFSTLNNENNNKNNRYYSTKTNLTTSTNILTKINKFRKLSDYESFRKSFN